MAVTVKYNGVNLSKLFVVGEQSRPLPEARVSTSSLPGMDGALLDDVTVGMRECSFTLTAAGMPEDALRDAARALAAALSVREAKRLVFSDERDPDGNQLHRLAVPVGAFDVREFVRARQWVCRFQQPDPYLYGKRRSVVLKKNEAAEVSAGGNAPAWWTATATPRSGSSYRLAQSAGDGWHVQFDAPFDGKHTLSLNARRQTARLAPAISDADGIRTGSRFDMLEGEMRFIASHKTTLSWTERWL